jgi:prevent-host-death family protein
MKNITVVEAKSRFSALLAEVEAGEEIAVTRHGKVVVKLVPVQPMTAWDALRDLVEDGVPFDIETPPDNLVLANDLMAMD